MIYVNAIMLRMLDLVVKNNDSTDCNETYTKHTEI